MTKTGAAPGECLSPYWPTRTLEFGSLFRQRGGFAAEGLIAGPLAGCVSDSPA
jgi:hypothetical protein